MALSTDWEIIGQSGPTTDGRVIDPQWLIDAAETYNTKNYTAQIWPFHISPKPWWLSNFGKVLALRVERTADGVVQLFAKLNPNSSYLAERAAGQKNFTSMELQPNFAESGRWYLTGLVATDDPASLGTSEVMFNKQAGEEGPVVFSSFIESQPHSFQDPEQEGLINSLVKAIFKNQNPPKEEADMADTEALKNLQTEFAEVKGLLTTFIKQKPAMQNEEKPGDKTTGITSEQFSVVMQRLDELETKFSQKPANDKVSVSPDDLDKVLEKFTALEATLKDALKEQPGTTGGEHFGAEGDLSQYT
ncbi:GPO family capsid scaffolding protein [Methylobacter sp. Wu8]|uniref:GPO family capsid scaffolding protein n=1 Tax=Methylobacter sp. Wu8 TaxID=3118457 RepID=UPI002F2CE848